MLKTLRKTVLAADADVAPAEAAIAGNAYVQTALLECPGTAARLGTFWEPPKLFGFGSKNGLKQVVADAAYSDGKKLLAPHHVLVELSEGVLAHDRRTGGHMGTAMARTLAELHQGAFADNLPEGTQARYRVVAAPDLPTGTVRVRLGPAIYVPDATDQPLWQVQLSYDAKRWDAIPPVTLQASQRLFILSGSADHGSQVCPNWPFEAHVGLVMLNLPNEPQLELSAEPLRSLDIEHNPQANWTVIRRPGAGPDAPCLYLRATRLAPASEAVTQPVAKASVVAAPPAPARARAQASQARIEPTLDTPALPAPPVPPVQPLPPESAPATAPELPSADDAPTLVYSLPAPRAADADHGDNAPTLCALLPVRTARLVLHGLALQRPSLFAAAGVQGLQWALDAMGRVVGPDHPGAALCFELGTGDELRLHTQSGPRVLPVGEALPLASANSITQLRPLPAQLAETCIGWLSLPPVTEARIPAERDLVVGRQADALKALRPLSRPGHLVALPDVGGDRMGLSRQHAELRLTDAGLAVRAIGHASLTHLDADMAFIAQVTADHPALLTDGQHLVLGHYIWRFCA